MPVIGRGNGDGVNVFALENLAKILLRRRIVAHHFAGGRRKFGQDVALNVAYMGDVHRILIGLERRQVRVGATIQADYGEVEAFIGAHDLAVAFGGRTDRQPCRSHRKCVKEFTSGDHSVSSATTQMLFMVRLKPARYRVFLHGTC